MYLTHLSLTNFRNYSRLDIEIPRRAVLLVGNNAQGKTNLLEAVYFLTAFTSFQTHSDRQMVNFIAAREQIAVGRLVADYKRGDRSHRMEARLILEPTGYNGKRLRKEILLDGVKRPLVEVIGHFNAVVFVPQMSRIIEGGPDERRRYINLSIAQSEPGYARALSEYSQAVTQRNALLKLLSERRGDPEQLVYWDEIISRSGAVIIKERIQALIDLEEISRSYHQGLTNDIEVLHLDYHPAFEPMPGMDGQISLPMDTRVDRSKLTLDEIREGFLSRLKHIRAEEISRGMTTIGPHRDDIRFLVNRLDLGDYGSRGQIRTALLALKLAEVQWMHDRTGQWPVILLDEVMAELDGHRRNDLLKHLSNCEQSMLTTTDLAPFDSEFVANAACWTINAGQVSGMEPKE
ncbi:MAG TPA: DNA replication/repair protein RecF [Anaerolineales bacterium]|nr:DNA replication/repair protein RecF [Anaerolineales bacterium]